MKVDKTNKKEKIKLIQERPKEDDDLTSYCNYFKILLAYFVFGGMLVMIVSAIFKLIKIIFNN